MPYIGEDTRPINKPPHVPTGTTCYVVLFSVGPSIPRQGSLVEDSLTSPEENHTPLPRPRQLEVCLNMWELPFIKGLRLFTGEGLVDSPRTLGWVGGGFSFLPARCFSCLVSPFFFRRSSCFCLLSCFSFLPLFCLLCSFFYLLSGCLFLLPSFFLPISFLSPLSS